MMSENLLIALQMTAIGMSLVFVAILLLWGLMEAMMRLTQGRDRASSTGLRTDERLIDDELDEDEASRKRRAAAAAVVLALAQESQLPQPFPLPQTSSVSPWQAVTRARNLNQRGPVR
jgi:Na+-transporting methylmalonyl-CoA/oxaloacetate decarboxylase gamma subunit